MCVPAEDPSQGPEEGGERRGMPGDPGIFQAICDAGLKSFEVVKITKPTYAKRKSLS